MRIAQVAPPFVQIPPRGYGGTERVVATLTEELVRRGHEVTLFASGDSQTAARLIPTVDQALWRGAQWVEDFDPFWTMTLDIVWDHVTEFDVIHSHVDHRGYQLARRAPVPVVTTLHWRLDSPESQVLYRHFADVHLVSISHAQRYPIPWANFVATVYHGIDLDQYTFSPRPNGYLAFLGRISAEKGLDVAIRVARRAGLPLRVAAPIPLPDAQDSSLQADYDYFEQHIQPLLDHNDVEFLGEIADSHKDAFLGGALALLFPIRWPEPFGLVLPESLACGTPVLALDHGSVREVVTDGLTGFVRQTEEELVDAVTCISRLSRAACRDEAERRFSSTTMANAYEQVYANVIASTLHGR